jgi:hypothetical protein
MNSEFKRDVLLAHTVAAEAESGLKYTPLPRAVGRISWYLCVAEDT